MKQSLIIFLMLFSTNNLLFATEKFEISIKNHRFVPSELTVPTGVKIKLLVKNLDDTPEEFESYTLNREKIIRGNGKAVIYIGPLKAGSYTFFGEFNEKTAQGVIIAK